MTALANFSSNFTDLAFLIFLTFMCISRCFARLKEKSRSTNSFACVLYINDE